MNILVIDQCSKDKQYPDNSTVYDAEDIDGHSLDELRERHGTAIQQARNLYTGRQQQYITQAIEKLETKAHDNVDRYFISAGFGLVAEDEQLPPYNVTFNDYTSEEIARRASELDIEQDILDVVNGDYDLIFFALGSDYYRTFNLSTVLETVSSETWVVCFNHESTTAAYDTVVSLPARTEQAKEQETIVVALKGKYLQNFADHRTGGKEVTTIQDVKVYCKQPYTDQSELGEYNA